MNITGKQLKQIGMILGALATVGTALTGVYQANQAGNEPKAEATYETLRKAVEELQAEHKKDHDDLIAIRAYLEGQRSVDTARPVMRSRARAGSAPAPAAPPLPKPRAFDPIDQLPAQIPVKD